MSTISAEIIRLRLCVPPRFEQVVAAIQKVCSVKMTLFEEWASGAIAGIDKAEDVWLPSSSPSLEKARTRNFPA